jgi:hypothetical protein
MHTMGASTRQYLAGVGIGVGLVLSAGAARADAKVSAAANGHFKAGVQELSTEDADRYEKAYAEFQAAYADSPYWKILGNLAIVAQALERDGEAIDAYSRYLANGGKDIAASEREQVTEDLARLEVAHATATLQTTPDGASVVDERTSDNGKPVVNRYGPTSGPLELRLRAGHHRIRAEADGFQSSSWEFDAAAGSRALHAFELRRTDVPSETPPQAAPESFNDHLESGGHIPTSRILGFSALGVGAVGVGAGVLFLVQANSRLHQGDAAFNRCSSTYPCPESERLSLAEGHSRTAALVSFSAAGAFLATGALLLIYGPDKSEPSEQADLIPWFGAGELGLAGRF